MKKQKDITIKSIKVSEIKPHPKNAKKHATEAIGESMAEFGVMEPILVDENNTILAGHGRLKALKKLGRTTTQVIVKTGLTEAQKEKYLLISNKISEIGGWDNELLAQYEEKVLTDAYFTSQEIDKIYGFNVDEDDFDPDQTLQEIVEPEAQVGDIYQLGDSRLMCGDSTIKDHVDRLMDGKEADMVFTDPPYNMNIEGKQGKIMNDNMAEEKFIEFSIAFIARMKDVLKSSGVFYVCSGYNSYMPFVYAMQHNGLDFANPIVWVKNTLGLGMNDFRHSHELVIKAKKTKLKGQPILYGWNGGRHYFAGTRAEADVWQIKRKASNSMVHPTQKPLELIRRAVTYSSKRGEIVLDLFGGSGSTLIGAMKENRRAYIMELDPKYCDVIRTRWEIFTGLKSKKVK